MLPLPPHQVTTKALTPTTSHPLADHGPNRPPPVATYGRSKARPDAVPDITATPSGPVPSSSSATVTVTPSKATSTLRPASPLAPPHLRILPRRLISFCRRVIHRIRPPTRISGYYFHDRNQSLEAGIGETTAGASTLGSASIMGPLDTAGRRRPKTAHPTAMPGGSSSSSRSAAAGVAAAATGKLSFSLGDSAHSTKPDWPSPPVSPGTATASGGTTAVAGNTAAATPSSPSSWSRRRWFSLATPGSGRRASTSAGPDTTSGTANDDHEAESGARTSGTTASSASAKDSTPAPPVRSLPGGGAEFATWFAPPPRPFVARPMAYINTNGSATPYGDLGNGGDAQWNIEVDPEPLLRRRRFHAGESITGESCSRAAPPSSSTPAASATNSRESGRSHDQLGSAYGTGSASGSTGWPSTPRTADSAASSVTTLFVSGGSSLAGGGGGACGASICSQQQKQNSSITGSNGKQAQRSSRSAGNGRPRTPVSAPATANTTTTRGSTAPSPGSGRELGIGASGSMASLLTTQTSTTACSASAQRRQTVPRMDSRSLNEQTEREQQRHCQEQQHSHQHQHQQHHPYQNGQQERRKQRPHRPRPQVNTGPLTLTTGAATTPPPPPASAPAATASLGSAAIERRRALRPRSPTLSDIYRDLHITPPRARAKTHAHANGRVGEGVLSASSALGAATTRPEGADSGNSANGSSSPNRHVTTSSKGW